MEKRNVYLEKIEANLAKYNAKLTVMKAEAAEVKADVKVGTEHAWNELKDSFEKAVSRFK